MLSIELHPIGHVRSPYQNRGDAPSQGRLSDTVSEIIIDPPYQPGLFRIDEEQHLFILCWFDRADRTVIRATPPHNPEEHGVFATRSPDRPNPVALSLVDLVRVKGGILVVRGLDALDGTPVIDIKPYVKEIDGFCDE
ncbi:MAG TPA: tRNA (N6-threonylcarbamoyladenosine(37)-N6)-methyltransferase TrmO [Methanoregulaceae archaeon]|nr:tRNA (N6-threonylcarbamoyladenosine(37)-N6)-methyltransferase TrmO [Methanoregulaceae archaeon]HPM62343.1 tRNA (N6-threonylcarbamoyladenosine(37)-N6)-methyltransferase TrmO [Methanoregulaceae archaeon]